MMQLNSINGLNVPETDEAEYCESCAIEKATQLPFNKKRKHWATMLLEVIHLDLKGPMNVKDSEFELPKYQFKPTDETIAMTRNLILVYNL